MPQFIVSYDLSPAAPNVHSTFKRRAAERRWSDRIAVNDGRLAALPNTTLCGEFRSFQEAETTLSAALDDTRGELNLMISITRNVIVQAAGSSIGSDDIIRPNRSLGAGVFPR